MTEWLQFHFSLSCIGEGNGNPLQCSWLENPRNGGAWWAAVYGVAQSRTRLKWLGSSRSNILPCLLSVDLFSEPFEGSCRHHNTLLWNTIPKNKQYNYHTWGIWILYNIIFYTIDSEIFQLCDTCYIFLFLSRIHSRIKHCICLVSVVFFL